MEEFQTLMPDRETFLRVWKRVMPDDSESPIAISPPAAGPARPPKQPPRPPERPRGLEWEELLQTMDEGMAGAHEIVRRLPGARPMLENLWGSARQVRSAYFLQTGRRWREQVPQGMGREPIRVMLRRQYVWEIRWADLCRRAAKEMETEDVREIFPELERQSKARRGMIRNLLAGT